MSQKEEINNAVRLTVNAALRDSIDKIHKKIDNCGYLTRTDSKQSDENKEYFKRVRGDFMKAIEVLEGMIQ